MSQEPVLTNLPAEPAEKTSRLPLILGLAGLILILGMTAMLAFYPFQYRSLDGEATVKNHVLYLKNNSDYQWQDVRLLLNTDYKNNTRELAPHEEYIVPLTDFKKDDGGGFKNDYTLVDLYVTAVTPDKQTISNIFNFDQ